MAAFLLLAPSASDGAEKRPGMVLVKGGCFEMGCGYWAGACDPDEAPVHSVCVGDFHMDSHEVTVGEFRAFVEDTGYRTDAEASGGCNYWTGANWEDDKQRNWSNPGFPQTDDHPVVCVSWNDAYEYIRWRSMADGLKYRFPTEAEWEYAARSGGKNYKYGWGDAAAAPSDNIADASAKKDYPSWTVWPGYDDGYVYTAPVASFRPNELGLYDMTGNALEWCADWYGEGYYSESPRDNPAGPGAGRFRVVRGSSWNYEPKVVRTTNRGWRPAYFSHIALGFRLAR